MTGRDDPRILVVGGGIIGCSVARELSGCGCRVILLERNRVGAEASSAAAGILSPQPDSIRPSPLLDLGLESLGLYADFVSALRNETGIDPEFESRGTLFLNLTREDELLSHALRQWQQAEGLPVEEVSARQIGGLEPGLGGAISGGLFFSQGAMLDPVRLTRAVAGSARRRGTDFREGCQVSSLLEENGRVTGVRMVGGERLEGDCVIIAAGAWSSSLLPGSKVHIFPVRGQLITMKTARPPRDHVLYTHREYLVPRRDGRTLVGSTYERVGFRKEVTPKAVLKLTAAALALDPSLDESSFSDSWCGFRPGSSDGLPLLGEVRPGLLAATGHYRGGILLAPITAALMSELIMRGRTSRSLIPFSPLREPGPDEAEVA